MRSSLNNLGSRQFLTPGHVLNGYYRCQNERSFTATHSEYSLLVQIFDVSFWGPFDYFGCCFDYCCCRSFVNPGMSVVSLLPSVLLAFVATAFVASSSDSSSSFASGPLFLLKSIRYLGPEL